MLTFQETNDFIQEQDWQEDHFLILTSESCNHSMQVQKQMLLSLAGQEQILDKSFNIEKS
jgi:hypothetical protein